MNLSSSHAGAKPQAITRGMPHNLSEIITKQTSETSMDFNNSNGQYLLQTKKQFRLINYIRTACDTAFGVNKRNKVSPKPLMFTIITRTEVIVETSHMASTLYN